MKKPVEERRTQILETTCEVVIERGFGNTRIADVAARLHVSTGLIHYYFDSKDQLLAEAFQFAAALDLTRLQDEVDAAPTALAKLSTIIALYAPTRAEPSWSLWIDAWGEALRSPALAAISQDLDLQWKDVLERVIRDGVAGGEFTCPDPRAAAWRIAALLDGLAVQVTVHDGVVSRAELRRWVQAAAVTELGLEAGALGGGRERRARRPATERSVQLERIG